jgi:hypothetical protein
MIVDEETGCVYSANASRDDPEIHIIKYDSSKNRFSKMNSATPKTDSTALERDFIRAHTPHRSKEGWFICITRSGRMFKFWPDQDKTEDLGLCWPAPTEKLYTTSIAISPDDKYIYYMPGAHGNTHTLGGPVVQYNTVTKERKALAFLFPYLYDETQDVAKRYHAACTPDFFVFDENRRLVYRGQMDDSRPGNRQPITGADLRAALDAVLEGGPVPEEQKPSMGCNIKWKAGNEPDYF